MMKYRAKTGYIECCQYDGSPISVARLHTLAGTGFCSPQSMTHLYLGDFVLAIGDWIVQMPGGELVHFMSDRFEQIFEPVTVETLRTEVGEWYPVPHPHAVKAFAETAWARTVTLTEGYLGERPPADTEAGS